MRILVLSTKSKSTRILISHINREWTCRWSAEMEEAFENTELPTANLHVDTKAFARIVCALLDIPGIA